MGVGMLRRKLERLERKIKVEIMSERSVPLNDRYEALSV